MIRRLMLAAAAAAVLAVAVAAPAVAGGGGHGGVPCAGYSQGERLVLRDSCLDGVAHFVPAGGELTVRNDGLIAHEYVAVDGSFGTGVLRPGASETITVPASGVHRMHCSLHAGAQGVGMAGVLIAGEFEADAMSVALAPGPSSGSASGATALDRVTEGRSSAALVALAVLGVAAAGVAVLARERG
jgi:hypothetical protein